MMFFYVIAFIAYTMMAVRILIFYCFYSIDYKVGKINYLKAWCIFMFWPVYLLLETIDSLRVNKLEE